MGTHSLIIMRVQSSDGTYLIWAVLYQHWDGFIDGVGKQLFNFLYNMRLTNGISLNNKDKKTANGAGDLFAQIIGYFKKGVGDAYLREPNDDDLEEYNYYVNVTKDDNIELTIVNSDDEVLFKGTSEEALKHFELLDNNDEKDKIVYRARI